MICIIYNNIYIQENNNVFVWERGIREKKETEVGEREEKSGRMRQRQTWIPWCSCDCGSLASSIFWRPRKNWSYDLNLRLVCYRNFLFFQGFYFVFSLGLQLIGWWPLTATETNLLFICPLIKYLSLSHIFPQPYLWRSLAKNMDIVSWPN